MLFVKYLLFTFAAANAALITVEDNNARNFFKGLILNFKEMMKKGMPKLAIPVLDPLKIEAIKINASVYNVTIKELMITGLSSYQGDNLNIEINRRFLKFHLMLPRIVVTAKQYSLESFWRKVIPLRGNGKMKLEVENLKIKFNGNFSWHGERLRLEHLETDATFGRLNADFENLLGRGFLGALANKFINSEGKTLFDAFKHTFLRVIDKDILLFVNKVLTGLNFRALYFPN